MSLRGELLALLAAGGHRPGRGARLALEDLLAVVADANPEQPPADAPDDASGFEDGDEPGLAVRTIACPHCGEAVTVELELDGGDQAAIQDCSVCCRPIGLRWSAGAGGLADFDVAPG